ncbi:hypothetical protein [Methanogenium sp. MK-MG]|uniref:hypothetical protein n=1 Tax=Methanogenium sp. MK-MG TaxID=2599926 RepID=UPI0013EE30DC|nr:hypothetical protein [Methanogenium sp. MK-MG]KAF1076408.1 hypothetical protein MKMG_01514 [Methanogenium sp. MK-MG]
MKRHEMIGIKQAVRPEWMEKICEMLLAGQTEKEIRAELKDYLSERMGRGAIEKRSETARDFAVGILMRTWAGPDTVLIPLRNEGLVRIQHASEGERLAIHHCMISAAYPFWYTVSGQIGILLRLQDTVTIQQIVQRTKEIYGDRQTVERNTKFVVRSLFYWGFLDETDTPGCYQKSNPILISSEEIRRWMIEAQLHAIPEGRANLSALQADLTLFPFIIPHVSGITVTRNNERIDLMQNGLSDELLMLKSMI